MLFDICTEFITTRERNGIKIFKVKDIMCSYVKATFIFDIMACVPGLVTGESSKNWYLIKVFRYIQMPRFFDQVEALIRKAKSHYVTKSIMITNSFMLFKTFFILIGLFHTLACCWIYIGNQPNGWRETFMLEGADSPGEIYVSAIYFISETATTIGYGDIYANTPIEQGFAIFLEFVGILIFSLITGNIRGL